MCASYVFDGIDLPSKTFIECVNAFNVSEFSLINSIELIKDADDWYAYFK